MTTWRQLTGDELEHGYVCESSSHADDDEHFAAWISSDEGAFMCANCYQKANPQEPMERPTCETCFYWDGEIKPAICKRYPRAVGHVDDDDWCGEHHLFPQWIEQQKEK